MSKVLVCRQKNQFVTHTDLRQKSIDGAYLHAVPATQVSQRRGGNVIFTIRNEQGQRREAIDDLILRLGSGKSL